ncbi:MAG: glycosyltransferase family 4 protein [Solirubrobacteraceae bacterium]|nr:glycosyltransferase family 4 protein [Solirubrobacteraceae bacterium]
MRVGVDARALGSGRGVGRHLEQALGALAVAHSRDDWRALVPGRDPLAVPAGVDAIRSVVPSRLVHGAAALAGRPRLDALLDGVDVVWMPAPAPVALSAGVPLVVTVHDRSFEARPADFTAYERLWHRIAAPRRLAARATLVLCVSETVREELLDAGWPIDPGRLRVVRAGPGLAPESGANAGAGPTPPQGAPGSASPPRDLLYVGALEPRKGVDVLARAFALARSRGLRAGLRVVGAGRLASQVAGVDGVRLLGPLDDRGLDAEYRQALALVLPSRLEGFGLPPLEAALRGIPSVLSDLGVFAETLGGAALTVPVGDEDALADALLRIERDQALRERIAAAAGAAAAALTWERTAAGIHAALTEAAAL